MKHVIFCLLLVPIEAFGAPVDQRTDGWCSPAIAEVGGSVEIVCHGADPKVLKRLQELLNKKDLELGQKIKEAEAWFRRYSELEQRLAEAGKGKKLAREAQDFLREGDLERAGTILDQLIATSEKNVESLAQYHFDRAEVYKLNFEPEKALPHYAKAYQYRPENFNYAFAYAKISADQKKYRLGANIYVTLLTSDTTEEFKPLTDAAILNNLGNIYTDLGEFEKAQKSFGESLGLLTKVFKNKTLLDRVGGPVAITDLLLTTANNLAVLYSRTERTEEARKLFYSLLKVYRYFQQLHPNFYQSGRASVLNLNTAKKIVI